MPKGGGTDRKLVRNIESIQSLDSDNIPRTAIDKQITRDRRAIPAALGTGFERSTGGSPSGGGASITSPLSEPNAGQRSLHETPRQNTTTDGVCEIEIRDLKTLDMEDGAGAVVQFIFAQPS